MKTLSCGLAIVAAVLLAPAVLVAQTGSVAGRVIDAQNGQAVPAAQVFIADLDIGVLTQQNGSYLLLNVPAGEQTVTIQRIGYRDAAQTIVVAAGETAVLDFRITEEALQLDEIIITGTPGGTQRRAIGNTVQTVDVSDVVQNAPVSSFQDLLTARSGGLRFARLSGSIGTGSPMTIRGTGSFEQERNQPLIFVDGIRVNNEQEAGPVLGSGRSVNVLDDFNPEDIESVEIIKGPAAASLYGTEASAGVIQIITKKGQEGSPEFNLSVRQGMNYMPDPAGRMGTFWFCPSDPAPGPSCSTRDQLEPYNMVEEANRYIREGYFPWPTENLYQNGHSQGYNLDVRGGTSAVRYFVSANYEDEEGFLTWNTDETFRMRANVGVVFNENFTLDISTGYVDGHTRFATPTVSDGGIWQDMLWSAGYFLDRNRPFDQPGSAPRLGGFEEHLPSDVGNVETTRDYSRFTGSATLNFTSGSADLLEGVTGSLTSRAIVGFDKGWDINQNLFPLHVVEDVPENMQQYGVTSWASVYSETDAGEMTYERPVSTNVSLDYSITATLDVNDTWGSATSFGAQYYIDAYNRFQNSGQGFASPLSRTINQIAQSNITTTYEYEENKSLGFYVQEELSWNDRLFLTGALRFDDNSTFGADAPARRYPKVSGTWVLSEESFWNVDLINSLRLRAAWGKAGRQPSTLAGFKTFEAMPGLGGASGIRPSGPGNPGVEPEVSTELELGFDVAFLDDRFSGEFTHYWRNDDNALLSVGVSSSFGIPGSVDRNLGRIANWGWEASLSSRLYESNLVSFDLDLSADYTNNEIRELGDPSVVDDNDAVQIGMPFPSRSTDKLVVSAQYDPSAPPEGNFTDVQGRRITALCDNGIFLGPYDRDDPNLTPEQVLENSKYGTIPGGEARPCADVGNWIWAGRAFATHTFSIAPRISLFDNQLQIFALAEGQYGETGREDGKGWSHIYNNSQVARVEDDPWWVAQDRITDTGRGWDKFLYDADFWKLREVGARYTLPPSVVERVGGSRASLAISARNIWTIWQAQSEIYGLPITDPEWGASSITDGGSYWETPPLATMNLTLRVTF